MRRFSIFLVFGFFCLSLGAESAYAIVLTPRLRELWSIEPKQDVRNIVTRRSLRSRVEARRLERLQRTQSSRSSSSSSRASSVQSSSSPSASSVGSAVYDTHGDADVRQNFLLLGSVTPAIAGIRVFPNHEPIDVTRVEITLASEASAVGSMLVYDETGRFLGRATRDSANTARFIARISNEDVRIGQREYRSFYVRAQMRSYESGGQSGQEVEVADVRVQGNGVWSSTTYSEYSSESFPTFESARARITSIESVGQDIGVLISGSDQLLSEFRFTGELADRGARAEVTDLTFQIETAGSVTVTSPVLRTVGSTESHSCSIVYLQIVCSNIPASFGAFDDASRTLRVYGDIAVGAGQDQTLRITLNIPGDTSSAGAVTWTDGTTSFGWVPFFQPVARGTSLKQ